jgi:XRE family transcriptional regulator, regulator of sulfur utilization
VAKHIGADRERTAGSLTEAVGMEITELRKERGWTQQRLADLLGYDVRYIGLIERGEKSMTLRALAAIAGGLEVRASKILGAAEKRVAKARAERAQRSATT